MHRKYYSLNDLKLFVVMQRGVLLIKKFMSGNREKHADHGNYDKADAETQSKPSQISEKELFCKNI